VTALADMTAAGLRVLEPYRSDDRTPFAEQVSAISALDGGALDGTPRPKPKLFPRRPAREPMDRSHTFFCSNPQCDHATWAPAEQARHMAREFWEVAQALIRLAPESAEALKLTGGVILKDLSDQECRDGASAYNRFAGAGTLDELPLAVRLVKREYERRATAGELSPYEGRTMCLRGLHLLTDDNLRYNKGGWSQCRACYAARQREWRERRRELHQAGDHSKCAPTRCSAALAALDPGERDAISARERERRLKYRERDKVPGTQKQALAHP